MSASSVGSGVLDYEVRSVVDGIRDLIRPFVQDGETLMYRDAFRWKDDNGYVIPNHYEGQSVEYLAEEFGYEIVWNFRHVAVVRRK